MSISTAIPCGLVRFIMVRTMAAINTTKQIPTANTVIPMENNGCTLFLITCLSSIPESPICPLSSSHSLSSRNTFLLTSPP